jgi:hypothetical protein
VIAYVFWHQAKPDASQSEYEDALTAFHSRLADQPPAGFVTSRAFALHQVMWLGGASGYEDWYLVENSAALDALDRGAVSDTLAGPHDRAAVLAATGIAGLYTLLGDIPTALDAPTALWFNKPMGMSYETMRSRLASKGCRQTRGLSVR